MNSKYIGVIGSGDNVPEDVLKAAYEVGRLVAEAGAYLVCGGRGGVMQSACQGAKSVGGTTIGILQGLSRSDANPFVDIVIPTGLGFALRNFITIRASDAVIMLHGEVGTLSEAVLSYHHGKPLVALSTSGGWASRLQKTALEDGAYLDDRHLMRITYASTPTEAVEQALKLIGTVPSPPKV
jgi:uncharacterized protein (TIGR00725 family)